MRFLIATPTLSQHDAVSTDVFIQRDALKEEGHEVFLYAQNLQQALRHEIIDAKQLDRLVHASDTILIYHHSIDWDIGFSLLMRCKGKIFVKYHNITPPEFFIKYDAATAEHTRIGRQQTENIACFSKIHHFLADSPYNAGDLTAAGVPDHKITIVPPFHRLHDFDLLNEEGALAERLQNSKAIKLLFVGRVSPNKGFHHLIETVKYFIRSYDADIELHMVGRVWANPLFCHSLESLVNDARIGGHLFFHEVVGGEGLKTFYKNCDIFLVMSEHEGFCVPIIEAQYHRLPVIALETTAVKETLGPNQLSFAHADYRWFASAIHTVARLNDFKNLLALHGLQNIKRFDREVIKRGLMTALLENHS